MVDSPQLEESRNKFMAMVDRFGTIGDGTVGASEALWIVWRYCPASVKKSHDPAILASTLLCDLCERGLITPLEKKAGTWDFVPFNYYHEFGRTLWSDMQITLIQPKAEEKYWFRKKRVE